MEQPLVSILVPVRNNLDFTKQLVLSLHKTCKWRFELIVIDNASTDGTFEWLNNVAFKSGKLIGAVIKNRYNKSFSEANNIAAKNSDGEFICLLNNDIVPTIGWLKEMMITITSDKRIGIVGAKLLHPGRGTIQHAGIKKMKLGVDHRYFGKQSSYKKANIREDVFAVTGACLLTRRKLWEKFGGLDEDYIYGFEDVDYCNRVRKSGSRIVYEPNAVLYHYESRTPGRYDFDDQNLIKYLNKWELNGYANQK